MPASCAQPSAVPTVMQDIIPSASPEPAALSANTTFKSSGYGVNLEVGRCFDLDEGMELAGFIRAAPQGRAKATFLRDEPKYWNRLGLLERDGRSYFHPGVGYMFNWRAIVGMVDQSE